MKLINVPSVYRIYLKDFEDYFIKRNIWSYVFVVFPLVSCLFYIVSVATNQKFTYNIFNNVDEITVNIFPKELKYPSHIQYYDVQIKCDINLNDNIVKYNKYYFNVLNPYEIFTIKQYKDTGKFYIRKLFFTGFDDTFIGCVFIILFICIFTIIPLLIIYNYLKNVPDEKGYIEKYVKKFERINRVIIKLYCWYYLFMGIPKRILNESINEFCNYKQVNLKYLKEIMYN